MKYLVASTDSVNRNVQHTSFPVIVEVLDNEVVDAAEIVRRSFEYKEGRGRSNYQPAFGKAFYVIPIDEDAVIVHFEKPQPKYDIRVERVM